MLSWIDYYTVWCKVNNVQFGGYNEVPVQAFEKQIPVSGLGRELGEMLLFMDEFGYTGGEEGVVLAQDVSSVRQHILKRRSSRIAARRPVPTDFMGRVCQVEGCVV